jgi:hypothetical protein
VTFFQLSAADKATLIEKAKPVYATWGEKIGIDYMTKVRTTLGSN